MHESDQAYRSLTLREKKQLRGVLLIAVGVLAPALFWPAFHLFASLAYHLHWLPRDPQGPLALLPCLLGGGCVVSLATPLAVVCGIVTLATLPPKADS